MNVYALAAPESPRRAAPSTVRYGSLSFAASARRNVEAALHYLARDGIERTLIDRLVHGSVRHRIVINHADNDSYDPNTHAIHWDPHSALLTTGGGRQSPALGLGHEIDHAVMDPWIEERLQRTPDLAFDTAEERRVVLGSEHHAARTLHEGLRYDHDGTCYRVDSPIAR